MSKKPTASEAMARKAAAAVAAMQAEPELKSAAAAPPAPAPEPEAGAEQPKPKRGRPRGRREVASKQTVYLDEARYEALARIAEDRGRSLHSLILEGVDHVIGKPAAPGWKPRD